MRLIYWVIRMYENWKHRYDFVYPQLKEVVKNGRPK